MPLPANGTTWPPKALDTITPRLTEWNAWYVGDTELLRGAYQRQADAPTNRPSQYRGGAVGAISRFFWGRPRTDLTSQRGQLHVPIAADLCQASADLLFAEPPKLTVDNVTTQDRLDALAGDGMQSTLLEAAEAAAALTGVFLRVTWDAEVDPDGPFLTVVHADRAIPEFRWGVLTAATFWTVIHTDGQRVLRHLERHETRNGLGVIQHGLYEGSVDNLGRTVPLANHPATAGLAELVDADAVISTETPGLAVVYVANARPQRRWRNDPLGANYGRSDLDGIEHLMDALDETYSSWMRDIRLGKARIIASQSALEAGPAGSGVAFDTDREVFQTINTPPGSIASGAGTGIQPVQFQIRYAEHAATADRLLESILRTAGYSAQTFGEGDPASGATATEIVARDARSMLTRGRKMRLWRPALQDAAAKLLAVDRVMFGTPNAEEPVTVTWPAAVRDTPLNLAQTALALRNARAASTDTLVRMQHPDWDDERVSAEVEAIDVADAVPDPADPGIFG